MTQVRLRQVMDVIEENAWSITTPRNKLFEAVQEVIEWEIERGAEKKVVTFRLVDCLGRRTEKLSDIFSFQTSFPETPSMPCYLPS